MPENGRQSARFSLALCGAEARSFPSFLFSPCRCLISVLLETRQPSTLLGLGTGHFLSATTIFLFLALLLQPTSAALGIQVRVWLFFRPFPSLCTSLLWSPRFCLFSSLRFGFFSSPRVHLLLPGHLDSSPLRAFSSPRPCGSASSPPCGFASSRHHAFTSSRPLVLPPLLSAVWLLLLAMLSPLLARICLPPIPLAFFLRPSSYALTSSPFLCFCLFVLVFLPPLVPLLFLASCPYTSGSSRPAGSPSFRSYAFTSPRPYLPLRFSSLRPIGSKPLAKFSHQITCCMSTFYPIAIRL